MLFCSESALFKKCSLSEIFNKFSQIFYLRKKMDTQIFYKCVCHLLTYALSLTVEKLFIY